jgi:hypothetical protein
MEAAASKPQPSTVTVTITLTDAEGNTQSSERSVPGGPTKVTDLKSELGVPPDSALWVMQKEGKKKKQLGDHETHNVKEDDQYEALVRGGVS